MLNHNENLRKKVTCNIRFYKKSFEIYNNIKYSYYLPKNVFKKKYLLSILIITKKYNFLNWNNTNKEFRIVLLLSSTGIHH